MKNKKKKKSTSPSLFKKGLKHFGVGTLSLLGDTLSNIWDSLKTSKKKTTLIIGGSVITGMTLGGFLGGLCESDPQLHTTVANAVINTVDEVASVARGNGKIIGAVAGYVAGAIGAGIAKEKHKGK